jgi:hypothetical protein
MPLHLHKHYFNQTLKPSSKKMKPSSKKMVRWGVSLPDSEIGAGFEVELEPSSRSGGPSSSHLIKSKKEELKTLATN